MLKKNTIFYSLFTLNFLLLALPMLSSCGKEDDSTRAASDIRLQILNLSPDAYPVQLFINGGGLNRYSYNTTPAYFYLTSDQARFPLQLRSTRTDDNGVTLSSDSVNLPNTRYSLFFTGLRSEKTLRTILTVDDTASLPPIGKGGRVRFVNTAARNTGAHDIYANGVAIIRNVGFAEVSNYFTLPPGNYNFRIYPANTSATSLAELNNITVQDGRLYTIYSRGIVGRAPTDSAAFNIAVLANNPPENNR
ncbi:DUF4397 domain-containing protein [Mucilaginibacter aquatilis]|uniref:DUF4397 domain-containing protein n=1 Tax=Mucilaginibacter aquatilis TaxID=1517760 RepID=A0A6I4IQB5_9SPHI|nr:DUF4397 domain-containing protein [Mucilaginibacter aquatilis]MVN90864.1 DUF4397 domain-containing protein [Mucilaginibacter aquatilis]